MDRAECDFGSDPKVSAVLSRLRSDRHQRRVFALDPSSAAAGVDHFVYRFSLHFKPSLHPPSYSTDDSKNAVMNRTLSLEEQREFWAQLLAVGVRYEARKRVAVEVKLELVEDVRETETSHI